MSDETFFDNPEIDRLLRDGKMEEALRQRIVRAEDPLDIFLQGKERRKSRQEALLYTGLTLGDFLYDYLRIDPLVVKGIDFARKEDLDSILSFGNFAEKHHELAGAALEGSINQLQGYVAEQMVAQHLQAQGYDVTFPDSPNQEGWDLLVDGQPFQVKCLESAGGVHEHLERFDIPVIVNEDLAEQVGNLDNVYVDPFLVHDQVREATENTLDLGLELTDFEIPWISLAVSSAAALRDLWRNDTDLQGAVTTILTNTAGRIALGTLGEITVGTAGLFLFGPAGAVVGSGTGAILGAMYGRRLGETMRKPLTGSEENKLRDCAKETAEKAAESMSTKHKAWQAKGESIKDAFVDASGNKGTLGNFMQDKLQDERAYFANKQSELEDLARDGAPRIDALGVWERVLTLIKRAGIHPHWIQRELRKLDEVAKDLAEQQKRFGLARG